MENNRFIVVMGWMMSTLGLNGNDLLAYAMIYGYSQDNQGAYFGSLSHTAEALNISRRAAKDVLDRLVDRGVITRQHVVMDGVTRCMYKAVVPDEARTPQGKDAPPSRQQAPRRQAPFRKPSREEIQEYCRQRGNSVDADRFYDYYEANGWVQGHGKRIKDWRAAVRTWERISNTNHNGNNSKEHTIARRGQELARQIEQLDADFRARKAGAVDTVGVHGAT